MVKEIMLTQGKVALVDDEDYELVNQYKWQYVYNKSNRRFWAQRTLYVNGKKTSQHMHRFIMEDISKGIQLDHKDHNGLNNQKENLREATNGQNGQNKHKYLTNNGNPTGSQYKGIHYCKRVKKWRTQIQLHKKRVHLGYFKDEIEAAKTYDEAAKIHYGDFALLNFA